MSGQKSLKKLQQQVDDFNANHEVGSKCKVKLDSGEIIDATISSKATVLGGHSAVGWFEEISGCYSLDRVIKSKK